MWVRESRTVYIGKARRAMQLSSPAEAAEFMSHLQDFVEEHFCVIILNNKNTVVTWREVSVGTVSEALVHPREVFRAAIEHGGSGVIVVHNHPSGDTQPSREDISTTKRLADAGGIIGIQLIDHIIVAQNGYASLKELGYI